MKRGRALVTGILICAAVVAAGGRASGEEPAADPREIASVYFSVTRERGRVSSYLMFLDKDGGQRSTSGKLIVSRKRTEYVKKPQSVEYGGVTEEKMVPLVCVEHIRNIEFSPEDFRSIGIVKNEKEEKVYALPLHLNWGELRPGERVVIEWSDFKAEQEVPSESQ